MIATIIIYEQLNNQYKNKQILKIFNANAIFQYQSINLTGFTSQYLLTLFLSFPGFISGKTTIWLEPLNYFYYSALCYACSWRQLPLIKTASG